MQAIAETVDRVDTYPRWIRMTLSISFHFWTFRPFGSLKRYGTLFRLGNASPGVNATVDPHCRFTATTSPADLGHPHILTLEGGADTLDGDEVVLGLEIVEVGVHVLHTVVLLPVHAVATPGDDQSCPDVRN